MRVLPSLIGALLAAAAASLHAQAPSADEAREKLRAERAQAEKACAGQSGAEHRDCMLRQMCAQQKDPKACEERVAKMKDTARTARCSSLSGASTSPSSTRSARVIEVLFSLPTATTLKECLP